MTNHSKSYNNIGEASNTDSNRTNTMIVPQSMSTELVTESEKQYLEPTSSQMQQMRTRTPTPPLPKRPDMLTMSKLDPTWRSSTATLLHIDVLGDFDNNGDIDVASSSSNSHEQSRASDRRLDSVYGQNHNRRHSSYEYGVPIDYQNGAIVNHQNDYSGTETAAGSSPSEGTLKVLAALRRASDPISSPVLQGPEPVLQDERVQRSRREQMLKRSSQVFPIMHHPRTLEQGDSGPHQQPKGRAWKQGWQRNKKNNGFGNKVSNAATLTGSDADEEKMVDKKMARELSQDEKEKLEDLFRKKKTQTRLEAVRLSSETLRPNQYSTKTRWLDQPSGCIPMGWMVTLICVFMLGYNGVLSAMTFQASRFPGSKLQYYLIVVICFANKFVLHGL
ncbi:hypothetical protein BGZ50_008667 [Haplosporangium sp. Z 11]|nr:hypothetical protein BGZ50_008667 [Haplosporangium sp. Z 11]